ncbi:MAG TPA: chemotaxis protein CheW [Pirellulaceae bacterium]|nr:chemotaxis protein CheW [Pirellulaceae bacterium]
MTFELQGEAFGIDLPLVQEINGFSRITPVPNAPRFVKGVLNLRGAVVPTIDLRARFGMPEATADRVSIVIVVSVGDQVLGLLVDAVSDVLELSAEDVSVLPDVAGGSTACCREVGRIEDRIVLILDLDLLVPSVELCADVSAA